jgi:arsenate reductase
MSDVTIYHNPSCGTSRNTLALIRHAGIEPTVIEYLKNPPSRERMRELIAAMGISARALLRQKGTPYAELKLDDPSLSDDALLDAMLQHPILINRPIVETELGTNLCRPSEEVLELLPVGPVPAVLEGRRTRRRRLGPAPRPNGRVLAAPKRDFHPLARLVAIATRCRTDVHARAAGRRGLLPDHQHPVSSPDGAGAIRTAPSLRAGYAGVSREELGVARRRGHGVERGLVTKEPNPTDARSWLVTLTHEGTTTVEELNRTLDSHAEELLSSLSDRERVAVESSLLLLMKALRDDTAANCCLPAAERKESKSC